MMHPVTIPKTPRVRLRQNCDPGLVPRHPAAPREDFLGTGLRKPTVFSQAERDGCRLLSCAPE